MLSGHDSCRWHVLALRGVLMFALAEWPSGLALQAEQPRSGQTPALTERAEIAPDGVTVRYAGAG